MYLHNNGSPSLTLSRDPGILLVPCLSCQREDRLMKVYATLSQAVEILLQLLHLGTLKPMEQEMETQNMKTGDLALATFSM